MLPLVPLIQIRIFILNVVFSITEGPVRFTVAPEGVLGTSAHKGSEGCGFNNVT